LVDTPASGAGDRKVVEVRVFFWAPIQIQGYDLGFHKNPRKRVFAFLAFENLSQTAQTCSSWRSLRPTAKRSSKLSSRYFWCTASIDFTTASQPNAGFASCYKC